MKKVPLSGNLVMVGFGLIGRGLLPLILKHMDVPTSRIYVIESQNDPRWLADKYQVNFINASVTRDNHHKVVGDLLPKGSFVVNVAGDMSSADMISLCHEKDALYIDSNIDMWPGYFVSPDMSLSAKSCYYIRHEVLQLNAKLGRGPTAMMAIGANPGMVSMLVKDALLTIARDTGHRHDRPKTREDWARLAYDLRIRGIAVSERDHQVHSGRKKRGTFVNTWSVNGFMVEALQPSEVGWGTRETWFPRHGHHHDVGSKCAIYLESLGFGTHVRSWTPMEGAYLGMLIPHDESISLAEYFTHSAHGQVMHRPTAFFAYRPCDDALLSMHEFVGRGMAPPVRQQIVIDEVTDGVDELGVLLYGHKKNAYWYGSQLSIHDVRKRVEHNNATSLQVTSTMIASMLWALHNPRQGVIEAEQIDHDFAMRIIEPYVAPLHGEYTEWTPLTGANALALLDKDRDDAWSFKNILLRG